jgi:hypothetical protein
VRTEYEGVPQPEGIEMSAGAQLSGVRLVFVYGIGVVRGTVTLENGPLPDGTTLAVTLRSVSGTPRQFRRQNELDARLQFVIENVPAGDYEVVVRGMSPAVDGKPVTPVEYLKQTVNVANGGETKVKLVVDVKKGSRPNRAPKCRRPQPQKSQLIRKPLLTVSKSLERSKAKWSHPTANRSSTRTS